MDIFTQNKLLLRIIFVLIFLNLFSIGYLLWPKKSGPGDRPPRKTEENSTQFLRKKLRLTDDQEAKLFKLRQDFVLKEQQLTAGIRAERDSMNILMFRENSDTILLKKLARSVADLEYEMEMLRIEQSQKLMGICTKEQLKEFQHLVIGIRDFLQPQRKKE